MATLYDGGASINVLGNGRPPEPNVLSYGCDKKMHDEDSWKQSRDQGFPGWWEYVLHLMSKEQLWLFREFGNFLPSGVEALIMYARPLVKLQ